MKLPCRFPTLLGVLMLASCSYLLRSTNIEPSAALAENESVVVTKIHGIDLRGVLQIHGGAHPLPYAIIVGSDGDRQLRVIKIRSGEALRFSNYRIEGVGGGSAYFGQNAPTFTTRPQTITYVGDVYLERSGLDVLVAVKDEETVTVTQARNGYPLLFSKYPYEKSLAGRAVAKTTETRQVPLPPN